MFCVKVQGKRKRCMLRDVLKEDLEQLAGGDY
jgi:hypothetical protein